MYVTQYLLCTVQIIENRGFQTNNKVWFIKSSVSSRHPCAHIKGERNGGKKENRGNISNCEKPYIRNLTPAVYVP